MKIAICGSGKAFSDEVGKKSLQIGKEIANSGHSVLTGGCHGYPNAAAIGAFQNNGHVLAYSPAKDQSEHVNQYDFPSDNFSEIIFTAKGIPDRNLDLVRNADAIILIDGKIGSLNEFTIAMQLQKKIGVLLNTGGISDHIKPIAEIIDKNGEKDLIIYEKDPGKLVEIIISDTKSI